MPPLLCICRLERIMKESSLPATGPVRLDDVVHIGDPTPTDPYGLFFVDVQ